MKILTIIGNGFDIAHGLPTRFENFINTNKTVFEQKYGVLRENSGDWNKIESNFENQLKELVKNRNWYDVSETVENIVRTYGLTEYGEVNYHCFSADAFEEEFNRIKDRVELISEFETEFQEYLKHNCGSEQLKKVKKLPNVNKIIAHSNTIINFNYTSTVEIVYGHLEVEHIHGTVDSTIAIGTGALDNVKESMLESEYPSRKHFSADKYGLQEMSFYYDYDDDGNMHENHFIKRFFDEVAAESEEREEKLFSLLDVKCKENLESRVRIIKKLLNEEYDRVYIMGPSLGIADYPVFNAINKTAEIICFYHNPDEYSEMKDVLDRLGCSNKLIRDTKLYKKT